MREALPGLLPPRVARAWFQSVDAECCALAFFYSCCRPGPYFRPSSRLDQLRSGGSAGATAHISINMDEKKDSVECTFSCAGIRTGNWLAWGQRDQFEAKCKSFLNHLASSPSPRRSSGRWEPRYWNYYNTAGLGRLRDAHCAS